MKKLALHLSLGFIMCLATSFPGLAQITPVTIDLKKGEILDILLISQNPDAEEDLKDYFKTAFPLAKKMTYQPLPGFKVESHTEGNIRPSSIVLAKWSDKEMRESFLDKVDGEIPDFHERRRIIWSYFGLTYYEIQKDLTLEIDRDRFQVATAFWTAEAESQFYKKWKKVMNRKGGKTLISLSDGTSPFGYQYAPTYFVIHSWESEADFIKFKDRMKNEEKDNMLHQNEFIIQ